VRGNFKEHIIIEGGELSQEKRERREASQRKLP
jgi:hypothetical protein